MACKPFGRAWAWAATKIQAQAQHKPFCTGASHSAKPKMLLSMMKCCAWGKKAPANLEHSELRLDEKRLGAQTIVLLVHRLWGVEFTVDSGIIVHGWWKQEGKMLSAGVRALLTIFIRMRSKKERKTRKTSRTYVHPQTTSKPRIIFLEDDGEFNCNFNSGKHRARKGTNAATERAPGGKDRGKGPRN
ncbi:hypothetical protein B0H17DRAFT_1148229 [Mycena rosella]|uniref:Uncharacterized protein n=1 Tax=Mycena rosella TaxID=1033263 RepID=A0AAD7CFB3_MYCRO|nr:hypothetical protein B0H17DRAFT_1148229 [Mycena rosella]